MKKLFTFWALAMCLSLWAQDKKITFAVLSDTHLGSFAYALDDLEKAIADINANPDIDLVIISGDITEFGTDDEIMVEPMTIYTVCPKAFIITSYIFKHLP